MLLICLHVIPHQAARQAVVMGEAMIEPGERLARLEEKVEHLASSENLQRVLTNLEKLRGELGLIKWMMGTFATAAISGVMFLIVRFFNSVN